MKAMSPTILHLHTLQMYIPWSCIFDCWIVSSKLYSNRIFLKSVSSDKKRIAQNQSAIFFSYFFFFFSLARCHVGLDNGKNFFKET